MDLAAVDAKSNDDLDKRYGLGIGGATYNGKIYGFPTEVSNYACVANKELWAKAGLDPAKDAPKTWAGQSHFTLREGFGGKRRNGRLFSVCGGWAVWRARR